MRYFDSNVTSSKKKNGGAYSTHDVYYSLRSELLVVKMDVSRTKIHLGTSISPTSISGRREYMTCNLLGMNRSGSRPPLMVSKRTKTATSIVETMK